MAAGDSAASEAERQRRLADEHARLASVAGQMARNFAAAAASEDRLARTLIELEPLGYSMLADRRWPGSARANVDLILVGPGGVIIVDAKAWREVTVAAGRVFRDQDDVTGEIEKLADLVVTAQIGLAEIGLAAGEVRALAVFTHRALPRTDLFGVTMLGEAAAVTEIARRGTRLNAEQIARVRTELDRLFPPMTTGPIQLIDTAVREPVLPASITAARATAAHPELATIDTLTSQQIQDALFEGVRTAPIEEWMAFLDPTQARLVRRNFNGPSRIRGAAGTGKTVVALHRAAHLARTMQGRVLVTTFVRTLPKVMSALTERLAPDVADRIDFRSVHSFARDVLIQRGRPVVIDATAADRIFKDLWERDGKSGPLGKVDSAPGYWQEEIAHVLKGRGLNRFEDYAGLPRTGRRRALSRELRAEVWRLYVAYEQALATRGILDWEDVILEAESSLAETPLTGYGAVIVDEAQDLSCAMIRMLHSVVGDAPDGLNLVGDGQQTIYPGGYTLAEAGVAINGRGVVLTRNYRNTIEIADFAAALVADDAIIDIEGGPASTERAEVVRHGPRPVYTVFPSRSVHDRSLVERVLRIVADSGGTTGYGDIGVLALYSWHAREAAQALEAAGIPTVQLEMYDGRPVGAVKVGTVKRAKGLEFKDVLVVRTPPHLVQAGLVPDTDDAALERRELQRRELYVAMTRARDGLWVGVA
ncbi:UvrD-helicase domain-containing protein [Lysinimonas soli]|uniref:DNA 3'-5' helicase n=1 Tax=Lysinimonas soli TaxID=1074233 RepID=A0ABW0NNM1_9MICO